MKYIALNDAFKNIVITNSLKSIRSLFLTNKGEGVKINYKPSYQREYVWPPFKGTYFIETILLHAEFSPIVIFELQGNREVIDGRQRCETIDRFLRDELVLKTSGLEKLWHLAHKKFSQLSPILQDRIESAKIRVITIEVRNEAEIDPTTVELVKRELFRRYNLGITPLKKEEVYKAQFLQDEINSYFKKRFQQDTDLHEQIKELFDHRKKNIEIQMQGIRQLLVLHQIPINRFTSEGDDIINIYYNYLSYKNRGNEKVRAIFNDFKHKVDFLIRLKQQLNKAIGMTNGQLYECLYWMLSIVEVEKVPEKINNKRFKDHLIVFLRKNIKLFSLERNNQARNIKILYGKVADFLRAELPVDFGKYMKNDQFTIAHKDRMEKYMKDRFMPGLEQEYFSKSTPTTTTILDIVDRMSKQKFNIRPPYQREEVKDKVKASALIESILKRIRLHPIYVYVRKDGVSEVIDGQQRLLAIIGFIGESYMNEKGNMEKSQKDRFALSLRTGLIQELHGKKFSQLSEDLQQQILNFDIDLIEIREENNPDFRPEELYKRLNYKPFPIKEHSFEFWNAYVDGEIISTVKNIYQKNKWLYLRKMNTRMVNEELLMQLIYFDCINHGSSDNLSSVKEVLTIYVWNGKMNIKIKNKSHVTRVLENESRRQDFIEACRRFEMDFVAKLQVLTYLPDGTNSDIARGRQLDSIMHAKGTRTAMNIYLIWAVLKGVSINTVANFKPEVKNKINEVFEVFWDADTIEELETALTAAWSIIRKNKIIPLLTNVQ
ncbi:MAG TPA: DUF262 domain-containing protein [Puia sp.]